VSKLTTKLRSAWRRFAAPRWRWPRRLGFGLVAVVGLWWVAVLAWDFPVDVLHSEDANSLAVHDSNGLLLRQEMSAAGLRENWVSLDDVSPHLVNATLASEDNDFFSHSGVDWSAIGRATWLNIKGGAVAYGGSTITMQLVRLVLGTSRSATGKVKQAVLAARLERALDKKAILEQYLNRVYYGHGTWGAEQAARFYFGKAADELSVGESALLAVIPRGPSRYNPFKNWSRVMRRRSHILRLMVKHGYLDEASRGLAERAPLRFARNRPDFRAPHFVEFAKRRLPAMMQRSAAVKTTLDLDLQHRIEIAVRNHLNRLAWKNVTQAAVVVLRNSDGAVLAMVGSKDYGDHSRNGAFNGATARLRPGSTLKPFVYATAIEQRGDTPATMAYDVKLPEDAHQFYTKDVRSHGFARYREALAGSYNLSAVHTLQRVGVRSVLAKLRQAGLATLDKPDREYDWGLAIGHAEVNLLDLTAAFSLFGRGGVPVKPRVIDHATTPDGRVYAEAAKEGPRVFSDEVTYLVYDILRDPDARKPMFGDRVPMNLPFDVALKTGTTKAFTDNWALGATSEYTVGIWAGNFDGTPTHRVMSVQGATPLMRAVYTAIAARYGIPTAPPRPEAVVRAAICPLSGKRPGPHCHHSKSELFITGQVPEERCDWHQQLCGDVRVVYPKEVLPWAQFQGLVDEGSCQLAAADGPLRIVTPVAGSKFLLEPHRPARYQKPPLAALPVGAQVQWTIDGVPLAEWVPTPGVHTVVATHDGREDTVQISYE
jgi:penicillin-binding protein 1C